MSVMGSGLSSPIEFTECRKNSHESKYELKSSGCNTNENKWWSFNEITNILKTDNSIQGVRQQILVCKKV